MSVARGIAQAKTYSQAYTFLSLQMLVLAVAVGAYGQHWWWGVFVPFVFVFMSMNKWTRLFILISLSSFWAFVIQQISDEAGAELWSFLIGLFAFFTIYAINAAGMIGLDHAVPDYH